MTLERPGRPPQVLPQQSRTTTITHMATMATSNEGQLA
jgi:hypothetical protein